MMEESLRITWVAMLRPICQQQPVTLPPATMDSGNPVLPQPTE